MIRLKIIIYITVILLMSCSSNKVKQRVDAGIEVPLTKIINSGNRYTVNVELGLDFPVPIMVHGNANLYLSLNHLPAEKINGNKPLQKIRDFGYSEKGMGLIAIDVFKIGNKVFKHKDKIPVFDQDNNNLQSQGMLGIRFLKENAAVINFKDDKLILLSPRNSEPSKKLVKEGYSYTRLFFTEDSEVYIKVLFDFLSKEVPIVASTVSDEYLFDSDFFIKYIPLTQSGVGRSSPSHTVTEGYSASKSFNYKISDRTFTFDRANEGVFDSFATYDNVPIEEIREHGYFGFDWMKKHSAIIDYANGYLYFK